MFLSFFEIFNFKPIKLIKDISFANSEQKFILIRRRLSRIKTRDGTRSLSRFFSNSRFDFREWKHYMDVKKTMIEHQSNNFLWRKVDCKIKLNFGKGSSKSNLIAKGKPLDG